MIRTVCVCAEPVCIKTMKPHSITSSSSALKKQWQDQRREAQRSLRLIQNQRWVSKAEEIQSYANRYDMHNFYDAKKSTHGPRTHTVCPLRTADESSLNKDQALIIERWGNILRLF